MLKASRITIDTPIQFEDVLPDKVDTVIIGGGIIGIFSALYLARMGKRVLLCEKGRIAGEQSSRNWGWIRQQGRDWDELPIMMQSLELWHEVNKETSAQCGVTTTGTYYFAKTEAELAEQELWAATARKYGLDTGIVTTQEVSNAFSNKASHQWIGGLCTPSDARAEPWLAVPAVARLAHDAGALIRENCAVRTLDIEAGQLRGVVTESGTIACDQVVLAAGAWSSLFARRHGVDIPQLSVDETVVQTSPLPDFFSACAWDDQFGIRRRLDGGYTLARGDMNGISLGPDAFRHLRKYMPLLRESWKDLGLHLKAPKSYPDAWRTARYWREDEVTPFENMRVLEPPANQKNVAMLCDRFARRFPEIGRPEILNSWAGMIDVMPDVVPIVDRVPTISGLIIATGMSGHGFGIGPGFGRVIARMVSGEKSEHDLKRFRFSRFSDGSKLDLRTSL